MHASNTTPAAAPAASGSAAHPDSVTFGKMAVLIVGVLACSASPILIKAGDTPAAAVAAWRLIIAAVALAPLFFMELRRRPGGFTRRHLVAVIAPAVLLAVHFWSFIYGARFTTAANVALITNLGPAILPFALFILTREWPNRLEIVGSGVALSGVMLLTLGGLSADGSTLFGDAVVMASMVGAVFYLALARLNRHFASVWLYLVPLYAVGAAVAAALAALSHGPGVLLVSVPLEWVWIIGLGLVPTVVGHSILNRSMRVLRPQLVSVSALGQFIAAGYMGYLFYDEVPRLMFYPAAVLMVIGALVVIQGGRRLRQKEAPAVAE